MLRLVAIDGATGWRAECVIDEHALADEVRACLAQAPDADLWIDGEAVPPWLREQLLDVPQMPPAGYSGASAQGFSPAYACPAQAQPELRPTEVWPTVAETMSRVFDDARRSHVQSLNDLGEFTRAFGELWIAREQRFADESVRQRTLVHQSLADIDLIDRSAKVVEMNARLSGRPEHRRERQLGLGDLLSGFLKLTGD